MMTTEHLPTPWREDDPRPTGVRVIVDAGGKTVATVWPLAGGAAPVANARLIKHAPRLLAAVRALLFANGLFNEPDHQHDPDTEWELAVNYAEAVIDEVE